MRREFSLVVGALALASTSALAACSGDDDAVSSTTVATVASTTTTSTTAMATTSTSVPPTTAAPTTTATTLPDPTTTPPSTAPTTTTLPDGVPPRVTFPDDPEKQAVVDAAYAFYDAANEATRNPTDAGRTGSLIAVADEPIRGRLLDFIQGLLDRNERVVGAPETRLDVYDFTVEIAGDSATFDACSIDADKLVATSEGVDVLIDGSVASWNQTYQLRRSGGVWRVSDITQFAEFEGQLGCGED